MPTTRRSHGSRCSRTAASCCGPSTTRRTSTGSAEPVAPARLLVAPEEAGDAGDAAAEDEAGHGRGDQDLLLMQVDLPPPVRGDLDLGAQALERACEGGALPLDLGADLLGRPVGGR